MKIEITIQDNDYTKKIIFIKPEKIEQLKKEDEGIIGWMLREIPKAIRDKE